MICPNCGTAVPGRSASCQQCGAVLTLRSKIARTSRRLSRRAPLAAVGTTTAAVIGVVVGVFAIGQPFGGGEGVPLTLPGRGPDGTGGYTVAYPSGWRRVPDDELPKD